MGEKRLTLKQKQFVDNYIENGGNASKAALVAYDTHNKKEAANIGAQNLAKPHIQDEINRKLTDFKDRMIDKANELDLMTIALEQAHDDMLSEEPKVRAEARKYILEVVKFLDGIGYRSGEVKHNHLHLPKWKG